MNESAWHPSAEKIRKALEGLKNADDSGEAAALKKVYEALRAAHPLTPIQVLGAVNQLIAPFVAVPFGEEIRVVCLDEPELVAR